MKRRWIVLCLAMLLLAGCGRGIKGGGTSGLQAGDAQEEGAVLPVTVTYLGDNGTICVEQYPDPVGGFGAFYRCELRNRCRLTHEDGTKAGREDIRPGTRMRITYTQKDYNAGPVPVIWPLFVSKAVLAGEAGHVEIETENGTAAPWFTYGLRDDYVWDSQGKELLDQQELLTAEAGSTLTAVGTPCEPLLCRAVDEEGNVIAESKGDVLLPGLPAGTYRTLCLAWFPDEDGMPRPQAAVFNTKGKQ